MIIIIIIIIIIITVVIIIIIKLDSMLCHGSSPYKVKKKKKNLNNKTFLPT